MAVGSTASTDLLALLGMALWCSSGALEAALACAPGFSAAAAGWADPCGSSGERRRGSGATGRVLATLRVAEVL